MNQLAAPGDAKGVTSQGCHQGGNSPALPSLLLTVPKRCHVGACGQREKPLAPHGNIPGSPSLSVGLQPLFPLSSPLGLWLCSTLPLSPCHLPFFYSCRTVICMDVSASVGKEPIHHLSLQHHSNKQDTLHKCFVELNKIK